MGLVSRILTPREIVLPPRTYGIIPHTLFAFISTVGLLIDRKSFDSPIYTSLFTIPGSVWGLLFTIIMMLGVYTLWTHAWLGYVMVNLSTLAMSISFGLATSKAKFIDGAPFLSLIAVAVWVFIITVCTVLVAVPTKVVSTR